MIDPSSAFQLLHFGRFSACLESWFGLATFFGGFAAIWPVLPVVSSARIILPGACSWMGEVLLWEVGGSGSVTVGTVIGSTNRLTVILPTCLLWTGIVLTRWCYWMLRRWLRKCPCPELPSGAARNYTS